MSYTSTGALVSSKDQTWTTPPALIDALHEEFHFTRDLASSPDTYAAKTIGKCWTPADDSLSKSWEGETGFLNPPYGRELAAWIAKAAEEVAAAEKDTTIVVFSNLKFYPFDFTFRPETEPCAPVFSTYREKP